MMTTVGPIFGDGGWFIIDDAYLVSGVPPLALHGDYLEQEATGAELTQFGDAILARRIRSPAGGGHFMHLLLRPFPPVPRNSSNCIQSLKRPSTSMSPDSKADFGPMGTNTPNMNGESVLLSCQHLTALLAPPADGVESCEQHSCDTDDGRPGRCVKNISSA